MAFESTKKVFREVMSEPGPAGTLSWGRVASSFALIASLVWVSYLLIKAHPIIEMPFKDLTTFILAPYGANRLATTIQAFSGNPVTPNPNQSSATPAA
jgi:hypothetical protein